MPSLYRKRITDPIHGTIELSDLELEVISSPAFQRLRNIKQLGLAHYVYPGADYSRFAHSLGVCHITGRILHSLRDRSQVAISEQEIQQYRLAALLHDVGHYPFSHAMERAIKDYFVNRNILQSKQTGLQFPEVGENESKPSKFFMHEDLSKEILENDSQLRAILDGAGIKPNEIYSVILRKGGLGRFANLVSSDLDADRMDYLLRTARHTGLPYGSVDLDYLVTQLCVRSIKGSERICLTHKALRTAEHLLLGRYFDYQQVNYHKTVAAFELLLEDVLKALIGEGHLSCAATDINGMIGQGSWSSLDDIDVISRVRQLQSQTSNPIVEQKISALLNRKPPKLLADYEFLDQTDKGRKKDLKMHRKAVEEKIRTWAAKFGIDESLWYVWDQAGITITKIGSKVPYSELQDGLDTDKLEQEVWILDRDGESYIPIVEVRHSLMNILSNYALYALRVYALLPSSKEHLRDDIRKTIRADVDLDWK